ncbi:MAG: FAD-dependent oxidoreductase, partial [Nitrospira sp.]
MAHYDLIVLGSGPAGQKAATQAAKLRKRVAIIEKEWIGGASVNTATLPSKTLKDAIYYFHGAKLRAFTNLSESLKESFTLRDLMARKAHVIKNELAIITNQLQRNDVEIIRGTGSFIDAHTIRVLKEPGSDEQLSADFIVIATGSRPRHEPIIAFNNTTIFDSDSILDAETIPKTMAVLGGGVIGCEYATMFSAFGVKVTLIDRRNELLRFVDQEVIQALIYQMRINGVTVKLNEEPQDVKTDERGLVVTRLKSNKTVVTDMLLFSMGRSPNVEALNLHTVGIATD